MIRALIHGSRGDLKKKTGKIGELLPRLAAHNIEVLWHAYSGTLAIDKDCDLVLMFTDIGDHRSSAKQTQLAKDANVPLIRVTHRWSNTAMRLVEAGYHPLPRGNKPPQASKPTRFMHKEPIRSELARMLCAEPWLSNDQIEPAAQGLCAANDTKFRPTAMFEVLAALRGEMGIASRGRGRSIRKPVFQAACRRYGVAPGLVPEGVHVEWLDAGQAPSKAKRTHKAKVEPKPKLYQPLPPVEPLTPLVQGPEPATLQAPEPDPEANKADPDATFRMRLESLVLAMIDVHARAVVISLNADGEATVQIEKVVMRPVVVNDTIKL